MTVPTMSKRTRLRTNPQRSFGLALTAIAIAALLPVLGYYSWNTIKNSREGRTVTVAGPATRRLPSTSAALLVAVDRTHKAVGLTLFALRESTPGGNVVVIPAGSLVDMPDGSGQQRLAAAYDSGGLSALTQAASNLLGVDLAATVEMSESDLTKLFSAVAPIAVTVDEPVIDTGADGRDTVLFPVGPVSLSAADAARFVLARGQGQSELARLPRLESFWRAAQTSGESKGAMALASGPLTVAAAAATALGGPGAVARIGATVIVDPARNPTAGDLLDPDVIGVHLLMAELLPGAISPVNTNARIWIEDPIGDPATLRAAVGKLVFLGANVVFVTTGTGPPPSTVTLTYQSDTRLDELRRDVASLGSVTEVKGTDPVDGVDAKITLGTLLQQQVASEAATSTTTTVAPTTAAPTTTTKTSKTTKATTPKTTAPRSTTTRPASSAPPTSGG
jgi:hypothetical protein